MSQIVLPMPASRAPIEEACADPSASCKPSRELLRAWLLLLVHCQETHGYELHRQLEAHGMTTEPGALYRTLRRLEDAGCVASSWGKSVSGPRRRLYQLTATGRDELDALVQTITVIHDVHAAFLHAHRRESVGERRC